MAAGVHQRRVDQRDDRRPGLGEQLRRPADVEETDEDEEQRQAVPCAQARDHLEARVTQRIALPGLRH
jgi:hypothetical protein